MVIAIIALLIGILLPALGKARATAQQVVCLSNMKQVGVATLQYAGDSGDQIWPAAPIVMGKDPTTGKDFAKNWAYRYSNPVFSDGAGLLYDYVDNLDEITECPTNKRRSVSGQSFTDSRMVANVGGDFAQNELNFDYTMNAGAGGAKSYLDFQVYGIEPPVADYPSSASVTFDQLKRYRDEGRLIRFKKLPIFLEESTAFYNAPVDASGRLNVRYHDGLWSFGDEMTTRHGKGGHMAMLDGSVEKFIPPNLTLEDARSGTQRDAFSAYSVFVSPGSGSYWQTFYPHDNPKFRQGVQAYGWINNPRAAP